MGYPGLPLRYSQLVIKPKLTYPKLTLPLGLPPWLTPWLPPGLPPAWSPWLVYPEYILMTISRFCPSASSASSASASSYYYLLLERGSARLGRVRKHWVKEKEGKRTPILAFRAAPPKAAGSKNITYEWRNIERLDHHKSCIEFLVHDARLDQQLEFSLLFGLF